MCILYFKYNREQVFVFCILALCAEVFDKSISNTFLESILYLNTFQKVSFTTLLDLQRMSVPFCFRAQLVCLQFREIDYNNIDSQLPV